MEKFSVILTVYNDEKDIKRLLDDINKQTCCPAEIIIVDGGSKDNTCKIIQEYDMDIRLIRGKRYNISQGLNVAIRAAKTEWLIIVAVGNSYEKTYFEELLNVLNQKVKVDGVYGSIIGKEETAFGRLYSRYSVYPNWGLPSNHGVLIRKSVFDEVGYFYENFIYAGEDAEFYRRARRKGKYFLYADRAKTIWDTPNSYAEFFRQKDRYILSDLQMYSNQMILNKHIKGIGYIITIIIAVICTFVKKEQRKAVFLWAMLAALNIFFIVQESVFNCLWKNIQAVTNVICLIKNWKYWKRENKIDMEYLIKKEIK